MHAGDNMIKNLIFDMGNTLLRFDPERFISERVPDAQDVDLVLRTTFRSGEWQRLDGGTLTAEAFLPTALERLPERLHGIARDILVGPPGWLYRIPEAETLVAELRERGCRLYLLSNASMRFFAYRNDYPVLSMLDGEVISAAEKLVKPDERIYLRLLDKYGLDPASCLFVDDLAANVEGARNCGIRAYQIVDLDYGALRIYLAELRIL